MTDDLSSRKVLDCLKLKVSVELSIEELALKLHKKKSILLNFRNQTSIFSPELAAKTHFRSNLSQANLTGFFFLRILTCAKYFLLLALTFNAGNLI